jgi:hypothetical protein
MPLFASFPRTLFRWVIGLTAMLGSVYLLLAMVGLAPNPYTCITETHKKVSGLSGFDFEISETDCSTLGEDASISVFAVKSGETKKVLLFKYGPAGGDPMPVIIPVDQHTIQISVSRISDLIFRRDNWEGLSINYNIGIVDYPAKR